MSKNQINYLLVLATLAVVWLYFHTFYMTAKYDKKVAQWDAGRTPGAMVGRPGFPPLANMPRNPTTTTYKIPSTAEMQKMIQAARSAAAVPATPIVPKAEEKK